MILDQLFTLTEGISMEDLADVLAHRLEARYPDTFQRYNPETIADAVMSTAEFHAGSEELGTSDIGIMLRQILQTLESQSQARDQDKESDVAEGNRFDEPLTGYHIVYRKNNNPVANTPSFETRDAAQKYLMTRMFANHQDYQVVHTADVGVTETSDYSRRREREEAIISGRKPARKRAPAQTSDYARRRQQEKNKEQGVAEGYKFTGSFPFDVDHMPGAVHKQGLPPARPTTSKKFFHDQSSWQQAVDQINSTVHDDNSEFVSGRAVKQVSIDGTVWAKWSDKQNLGYIDMGTMSEQGVAEGEYDSNKPYGVRYRVFAGREGRLTTKEYWTTSPEKLDKAIAKIKELGNFYEIDAYSYPDKAQDTLQEATRPLPGTTEWQAAVQKAQASGVTSANLLYNMFQNVRKRYFMQFLNDVGGVKISPQFKRELERAALKEQGVAEGSGRRLHFKSLSDWERAVSQAWPGRVNIEQQSEGIYAARLANDYLVGVFAENQGGWLQPSSSKQETMENAEEAHDMENMSEARKANINFDIEDIKRLEQIRDLETLKAQAIQLISRPSQKPMKPEKVAWFQQHLEGMRSPMQIIKMMYDLMLSGEGHAVIGSRHSTNPNSYRTRFGEEAHTNEAAPATRRSMPYSVWQTKSADSTNEGYRTDQKNRDHYDDIAEWKQAVTQAGGGVWATAAAGGKYLARDWNDQVFGEFDKATGQGWIVSDFTKVNEQGVQENAHGESMYQLAVQIGDLIQKKYGVTGGDMAAYQLLDTAQLNLTGGPEEVSDRVYDYMKKTSMVPGSELGEAARATRRSMPYSVWQTKSADDQRFIKQLYPDLVITGQPRVRAAKPKKEKIDYQEIARKIEQVVGSTFPDGDPIDLLIPYMRRRWGLEWDLGRHLDRAAKRHLGARSYDDYLATLWDQVADDELLPDRVTRDNNPWRAREGVEEGWKSTLGAAALAGAMALGAGGAQARVSGDSADNPEINRLTGKPNVTQVQPAADQSAPAAKKAPGYSAAYLQSVIDGTHPRPMISKERAQDLLQQIQQAQPTNEAAGTVKDRKTGKEQGRGQPKRKDASVR